MTTEQITSQGASAADTDGDAEELAWSDPDRTPKSNRIRDAILRVPGWVRWLIGPLLLSLFLMAGDFNRLLEIPYAYTTRAFGTRVGDRLTEWINWLTANSAGAFDLVDSSMEVAIETVDRALLSIPWPATVLFVAILAWRAVGPKTGIFALVALSTLVLIGLWDASIETISLIIFALSISMIIAIPLGILNAEVGFFEKVTRPILDVMQTMPSMVYLVPALAVFGLGDVAGVMATAVFAIPPTVNYTTVGLRGVPSNTIEAAQSFGATNLQILTEVKLPLAMPTIMAGISQSTMQALGLVIIASIVGARGLGEVVEKSLTRLDTGHAVPAGFAIVLIAILIDRVTEGLAKKRFRELGLE